MNFRIKQVEAQKLEALGFELINDQDYLDFYRCEDLTKSENLREGVTFNSETGKFYAMLDIQSDYTDGTDEFGTSEEFLTIEECLCWLKAAALKWQLQIHAVAAKNPIWKHLFVPKFFGQAA